MSKTKTNAELLLQYHRQAVDVRFATQTLEQLKKWLQETANELGRRYVDGCSELSGNVSILHPELGGAIVSFSMESGEWTRSNDFAGIQMTTSHLIEE